MLSSRPQSRYIVPHDDASLLPAEGLQSLPIALSLRNRRMKYANASVCASQGGFFFKIWTLLTCCIGTKNLAILVWWPVCCLGHLTDRLIGTLRQSGIFETCLLVQNYLSYRKKVLQYFGAEHQKVPGAFSFQLIFLLVEEQIFNVGKQRCKAMDFVHMDIPDILYHSWLNMSLGHGTFREDDGRELQSSSMIV